MIYRIAKWSETFETADSRRHKSLHWVSVPNDCHSNGYAQMIEHFGDEAPAIFGAWIALVKIASTCPIRGILSTSSGAALTVARFSFISHFPSSVFEKLIEWASAQTIGWLEVIPINEVNQLLTSCQTSGNWLPNELPDQTRPNLTLPDKTRPDPLVGRSIAGRSLDVSLVDKTAAVEIAKRVAELLYPVKADSERLVRYCVVAMAADRRSVLLEAAHAAKAPGVRKKTRYWEASVETAVKEAGFDFDSALRAAVVPRKDQKPALVN